MSIRLPIASPSTRREFCVSRRLARGRGDVCRLRRQSDVAVDLGAATQFRCRDTCRSNDLGDARHRLGARERRLSGARADVARHVSRGANGSGLLQRADRRVHARHVHRHRIREQSVCLPVSRVAVHDRRRRRERARPETAPTVRHASLRRRADVYRLTSAPSGTRRPSGADIPATHSPHPHHRVLRNVRKSSTQSVGCSAAGKCPPRGMIA